MRVNLTIISGGAGRCNLRRSGQAVRQGSAKPCVLGAVALTALLGKDGFFPQAFAQQTSGSLASKNPLAPKQPHFAPKAKSVIWLYMHGAPSTLDLYDYKPDVIRLAGKPVPESFGPIKTAHIRFPCWCKIPRKMAG